MNKKIIYICSTLMLVSLPIFVLAQGIFGGSGAGGSTPPSPVNINVGIGNPFKGGNNLTDVIQVILQNIVMPLGAVLVVLAIIYSGFKYLTAQGKPEEIKKANQGLMYVLIGAGVLLGATAISLAIQGTLAPFMGQ